MKSLERPLGRIRGAFSVPSTSWVRLIRFQSATLPSLPCRPGICQCDGTSMSAAAGKRSSTSWPRGSAAAAGST
jgi:hypothetical protein